MVQTASAPDSLEAASLALEDLRAALSGTVAHASCHAFLAARSGRNRRDKWRRLRFTAGLATHFRAGVVDSLLERLPSVEELVVFGFVDPSAAQTIVIPKSEYPAISAWFDDIPGADWDKTFDGSDVFLKRVNRYVTTVDVRNDGNLLKVVAQKTITSLLKKRGFYGMMSPGRHEFTEVVGQVFDFPLTADFIEWGGFIFVFKLRPFEALTGIREVTLERATLALKTVTAIDNLDVPNIDGLLTHLENKPQLAKKLAAAHRHGTLGALSAEAIADRIDELDIPIRVRRSGDRYAVDFDSTNVDQVKNLIDIITDVYLLSPVTQLTYRTGFKEVVSLKRRNS